MTLAGVDENIYEYKNIKIYCHEGCVGQELYVASQVEVGIFGDETSIDSSCCWCNITMLDAVSEHLGNSAICAAACKEVGKNFTWHCSRTMHGCSLTTMSNV